MVMTDKEKQAPREKFEHPEKTVLCPRCGSEVIYEVCGNSIAIECKKEKCIYGGMRSL